MSDVGGIDRRYWHLDKTVSAGHIVTTFGVAIAMLSGWVSLNNNVAEQRARTEMLTEDVRDLKAAYVTQNELHRLEYKQTRSDFESMRKDIAAEFRQLRLIMSAKADKP